MTARRSQAWARAGVWAWRRLAIAAAVALAVLYPARSRAQTITSSEFKLGVWDHDTKALEGREKGIDINPELIWQSPITAEMIATAPDWLRWALQPRPTIGGAFNTAGVTNQFYLGATWSWMLASNIINPDDGIFFGYFFGPGFNDGVLYNGTATRKALGSHILFREAGELGYQINATWSIAGYIDHISNGGLAKANQSINDLGVRLGYRF
jgi:hypothetical protein